MHDDIRKVIFIQWESEYIDNEDKGVFHLYAHTVMKGVKTIQHSYYLCEKNISAENKPLEDRYLDYLQEGEADIYASEYCKICKAEYDRLKDKFKLI